MEEHQSPPHISCRIFSTPENKDEAVRRMAVSGGNLLGEFELLHDTRLKSVPVPGDFLDFVDESKIHHFVKVDWVVHEIVDPLKSSQGSKEGFQGNHYPIIFVTVLAKNGVYEDE